MSKQLSTEVDADGRCAGGEEPNPGFRVGGELAGGKSDGGRGHGGERDILSSIEYGSIMREVSVNERKHSVLYGVDGVDKCSGGAGDFQLAKQRAGLEYVITLHFHPDSFSSFCNSPATIESTAPIQSNFASLPTQSAYRVSSCLPADLPQTPSCKTPPVLPPTVPPSKTTQGNP